MSEARDDEPRHDGTGGTDVDDAEARRLAAAVREEMSARRTVDALPAAGLLFTVSLLAPSGLVLAFEGVILLFDANASGHLVSLWLTALILWVTLAFVLHCQGALVRAVRTLADRARFDSHEQAPTGRRRRTGEYPKP